MAAEFRQVVAAVGDGLIKGGELSIPEGELASKFVQLRPQLRDVFLDFI